MRAYEGFILESETISLVKRSTRKPQSKKWNAMETMLFRNWIYFSSIRNNGAHERVESKGVGGAFVGGTLPRRKRVSLSMETAIMR